MEMQNAQETGSPSALTPMKAVWMIVLLNLVLTAGVVFAWHFWATEREHARNAEEIGVMETEAMELTAYLETLPPRSSGKTGKP